MKAVLVIDMPDNLDIPLEDIKAEITVWSKDVRKSMLYLKYKNAELKPLPSKKVPVFDPNSASYDEEYEKRIMNEIDGWNACIEEIEK